MTYRRKKKKGHKAALLKDLPVEEIHYYLNEAECTCESCGNKLRPFGQKVVREEVQFIPAS